MANYQSPTVEIKITNLPQIRAAFNKAPELMRVALPKAINKSLLTIGRAADIILQEKVYQQPISKSGYRRTGNLLSSILDPNRGLTLATEGLFRGSVGAGVDYGIFVELGTKFMPARPFIQPAAKDSEPLIQSIFTETVQVVLDDIAGRTLL